MIDNISELMEFIEWCKKNGVKRIGLDNGISFELSDMALSEKYADLDAGVQLKDQESASYTSKTMVDTADTSAEDEELLYWSSKS